MALLSPRPVILTILVLLAPVTAWAQSHAPATTASAAQAANEEAVPALQVNPGEPDFTLGALPTTLRMPDGKFAFRLTHRFSLPINSGDAGDFFSNFFNFDSSAQIGFELRYGLRPGTQLTMHRTNDRTIQLMGQHQIVQQGDAGSFSADVLVAVEGRENLSERYATTIAGVISHRMGAHGAFYVQPMVVLNANTQRVLESDPRHAGMIGFGARIRIGASRTYLVGEASPRLTSGYHAGSNHVSVGIEKRAGGHMFQLNVSNDLGTTFGQLARGGFLKDKWFIGFNLTRKFY